MKMVATSQSQSSITNVAPGGSISQSDFSIHIKLNYIKLTKGTQGRDNECSL